MKLLKLLPIVVILFATTAVAEETIKFGYVDFNQALNQVNEGKKAKAKLQKDFNAKQKQLEKKQNELKAMKEKLEKERLLLSSDAFAKKEEVYRKGFMEMQQMLYTFKQEMAQEEAKVTQEILTRLRNIVRDVGKKDSYTMIFEKSQDVVLYSPTANDITEKVIKIFNKGGGKK